MPVSLTNFVRTLTLGSMVGMVGCIAGCNVQINGGYNFNFQGKTASNSSDGEISDEIQAIEIENRFGMVDVQATDGATTWSWSGKCWAKDQGAADRLAEQLAINVSTEGDRQRWTVAIPEDAPNLRGVESNLTLAVNPNTTVLIRNAHGNVKSVGVAKSIEIENAHGEVQLESQSGPATINNRHGKIHASGISDALNLNCRHGDIVVQDLSGKIMLECEHGDIQGTEITGDCTVKAEHGSATLRTSAENLSLSAEHCNVQISQSNASFAVLDVNAEHGNVKVTLPTDSAPKLKLSVEHGRSDSEFTSSDAAQAPLVSIETEHGNLSIHKGA